MIDIGFFYLLLLILLILLLFIILFYSEAHTRIIVPSLLDTNYKLEHMGTTTSQKLQVYGHTPDKAGFNISRGGTSYAPFEFAPYATDSYRRIVGSLIFYGKSLDTNQGTSYVADLQLMDQTKVVGEATTFRFFGGLSQPDNKYILNFDAPATSSPHLFELHGKKSSGIGTSIALNSAYLIYY